MEKTAKPRHYLRQWRKHANLRLEDVRERAEALLADRVVAEGEQVDLGKIGLSHSTLSRIETFKVPYNQALLEVLAEVYGAPDAGSLVMRNPLEPDALWSIIDQISPEDRVIAVRILSGLKTGTNG